LSARSLLVYPIAVNKEKSLAATPFLVCPVSPCLPDRGKQGNKFSRDKAETRDNAVANSRAAITASAETVLLELVLSEQALPFRV
jgi:hypothetical protein